MIDVHNHAQLYATLTEAPRKDRFWVGATLRCVPLPHEERDCEGCRSDE
jgi:hypothetical protein